MKNIGIASSDNVLDKAIGLLFQDRYQIFVIEINEQLSSSLKKKSVDLLIIDLMSIDMEGLKLVNLFKKIHFDLPVILLYDLKMPGEIKPDLFQLADVMLRKPFRNQQLISAVSGFLN